mmetsp:Transcript_28658/g.61483  ORF Transcript_28658/g.61483 Transcript_28658/m.61483 type:complete len:210 (-) Transcript_28658:909-1538(-)
MIRLGIQRCNEEEIQPSDERMIKPPAVVWVYVIRCFIILFVCCCCVIGCYSLVAGWTLSCSTFDPLNPASSMAPTTDIASSSSSSLEDARTSILARPPFFLPSDGAEGFSQDAAPSMFSGEHCLRVDSTLLTHATHPMVGTSTISVAVTGDEEDEDSVEFSLGPPVTALFLLHRKRRMSFHQKTNSGMKATAYRKAIIALPLVEERAVW